VHDPAPVDVLLIDDDPADVLMIEEALADWHVPVTLHVTGDGEQGRAFLRHTGRYVDAPRPALVILDLNMPRMNGFEVLADIKTDFMLSIIPIVVFTTSRAPEHVARGYADHANAYVVKPTDVDDYQRAVRSIEEFYTRICVPLPAAA
jgi:CheY-like chemotaxis protein